VKKKTLYSESKGHYLLKKYYMHFLLVGVDLLISLTFYKTFYSRIEWNTMVIIITIPLVLLFAVLHIIAILRLIIVKLGRLEITDNSIIETNRKYNLIREIPYEKISYIGIDNESRSISIFDKEKRRVMIFSFLFRQKFWQIIYVLRKTGIRLKPTNEDVKNLKVDKSFSNSYQI